MSAKEIIPLVAFGVATGGAGFALAGAGAAGAAGAAGGGLFSAGNIALASAGISGLAAVGQGIAGLSAANAQATQAKLQRTAEATQKATEDLSRERSLRSVLSAQRAQFAAGGVSLGSGTVQQIGAQSIADAGREASSAERASGVRQAIFGINAKSAKTAGLLSLTGGILQGAGTVGKGVATRKQIGGDE